MKKWMAIILSLLCSINLVSCSVGTETAEVPEKKLAGTIQMEKARERAENKESNAKKKKAIRLGEGNALAEASANPNEYLIEEYMHLFANGSFDKDLIWTTDDTRYEEVIETLRTYCEENIMGSVILATDEEILFAGGFNAMEADGVTAVNPATTYEIGSITQQFMGAAILQQIQEGNLKISDTIDRFFPEYSHGSEITIEHLLHMQSGIPDYINESLKFFSGRTAEEYEAFMNGQMTDETILGYLYKAELLFEPGKKSSYSNTNFYLLALILEQVTGVPYAEYIQNNLIEACKLSHTTCLEVGNITGVPGENGDYFAVGNACRGVADMHSNICDILLWNRALMAGKVIEEEQLNYLNDLKTGFSCGWNSMGENVMGDFGSTWSYGYANLIYQDSGENIYFIVLCPDSRKMGAMWKLLNNLEDYLAK